MKTEEIPQEEWTKRLTQLGTDLVRKRTHVVVLDEELGAQTLDDDLPLLGIAYDPKSEPDMIHISLALETPRDQVEHVVAEPRRVFVMSSDDGSIEALDIEDCDGRKTLVTFPHDTSLSLP